MRIWLPIVLVLATLPGGAGCGGDDVTASDGGASDGGTSDASADANVVRFGTRYPSGALHSPMTRAVVDRLTPVIARGAHHPDVFAKVGDSITEDPNFLDCFAGSDVMYGSVANLDATRTYFNQTPAGDATHSSFNRVSLAAVIGWFASAPLMGSPNYIQQEVTAIDPAFAVMMFGTNDTSATGLFVFEQRLTADVDALLDLGVVPIVSTIPPRADATANALVPEYNAVIRAVAQHRQVPYMDLWQTLLPLPGNGLTGDGIHLNAYSNTAGGHPCWFTSDALMKGMNQRNLITLQALDRARRFLGEGAPVEPDPPELAGSGTWDDPFLIDRVPFVDVGDTSKVTTSVASVYACGPQNEGGSELVYRITLGTQTTLRARVYTDTGVDVNLHWLDGPSPDRCVARADKTLDVTAGAGTHWLVVDTFVSGGQPLAGPFRLALVRLDGGI